ncbi:type IV toxin-antitoxin system AbiEi family antitoxin domain-containing protein [bacterium]|nr:type IV toxin-antitoxin system AbiEi family antitoxin domain-containing protein [bacterium]
MDQKTQEDRALEIIRGMGILRSGQLEEFQIPRMVLSRLLEKGKIERIEHGLYMPVDQGAGEMETVALAARKVPGGVVCLLSALSYHGLTTEIPHQVWMAIDRNKPVPKLEFLPVRLFRFSGDSYGTGILTVPMQGRDVSVYSPAKTVADCFKFRNRIGTDVAVEALRDCLQQRKCSRDDLWRFAKIDRVQNVMLPYLEATA